MAINIVTFGVLHGTEPATTNPVRVDLTEALRNPADDPKMIELTGLDWRVREHVMNTPGAHQILSQAIADIEEAARRGDVDVLVYCRGGRHRSVAMGEELADWFWFGVRIVHRDVDKGVVR